MGTEETAGELVKAVQAALAEGADGETKLRAATILRSVLAVLEPASGAALLPPSEDFLDALLAKFKPLLPDDREVPRLSIPFVQLPPK